MGKSQIELWTDNGITEFAIFLNSEPVVKTNGTVKFTKRIDRAIYVDGYKYNWEQTLDKWITFYFSNKYIDQNVYFKAGKPTNRKSLTFSPIQRFTARVRLTLRCNFCGLKFRSDNERKEHEHVWHPKRC